MAGVQCFPIDICLFSSHNVLDLAVEHRIVHMIQSGRVNFVWLGMPCTSFSRARKWDGLGPGPLRDYDNLNGFSWLCAKDKYKVWQGNELLRFSLRIVKLCDQLHIPYALENPYSSYLWHMPSMVRFIRQAVPWVITLDYCQYGEPWQKPTTIMGNHWDVHQLALRCQGHEGNCSATKRPHLRLAGVNKDGMFRTLAVQPYPRALTRRVADLVTRTM